MGGAWSAGQIILAFRAIGYINISVESEEVTEAYARKWGHGPAIRDHIQSSLIYAEKPLEGEEAPHKAGSRDLARGRVRAGKALRRFSGPAVAASDTDEEAAQEAGDVGPPGDPPAPAEDA